MQRKRFSHGQRATLIALSAVILIMLVPILIHHDLQPPPDYVIREITMAPPPPLPPPPLERPPPPLPEHTPLQLDAGAQGVPVLQRVESARVDMPTPALPPKPPLDAHMIWSLDLDSAMHTFSLEQLDEMPRLLTRLSITFPQQLVSRGVLRADVELNVTIDQRGRVMLNRVNSNPHPELDGEIQRLVRVARFTPPKRDGEIVRARFNWPLELAQQ